MRENVTKNCPHGSKSAAFTVGPATFLIAKTAALTVGPAMLFFLAVQQEYKIKKKQIENRCKSYAFNLSPYSRWGFIVGK